MKVLVLLVVLSVAIAAEAQGFYCGRRLALALAMLCEGSEDKRGDLSVYGSMAHERADHQGDWSVWPPMPQHWLHANRAHSLGRPKRQVVMECCMKPCSEDELMAYC
ncbi:insulin-related peptide 1-like [Pieris brassicae]|uniref:insulin-related peptide 1-like n=1 Tax=Pieris brassicae TaxID=7116 RepID=UPI001E6600D9|nr:insulin-related peptide 1-like [Pieris brassicae]